jgi:alkanesulfonate monooxygenase SsuD/methylene tetrahydromethanopterin reductase-like flavin-dependent oxidoreductase (luciferase family)
VVDLSLHYDFRAPAIGPVPSVIYRTALEQCAWADALGFSRVVISSHHGCDDDYGPSPLIAATALASVTNAMRLVPIIALPLYHPLHVAEDTAVLDQISAGRLDLLVVAGYRPNEFAMFGSSMSARGALMEEGVQAIRTAWTGEEFELRGHKVRVSPRPYQRPGPAIVIGGDTRAAARRAVRIGDGYAPMAGGDSWKYYQEACAEFGRPVPPPFSGQRAHFIHVTEDPEAAWPKLAPHLLHVNNSYAQWMTEAGGTQSFVHASTVDDLKASDAWKVLTPDECVSSAREWGGIMFDPMCGGIAPELAWASLELVRDKVVPKLTTVDT